MIDNNLIKQLDSSDPERRKKAIQALARTKNPEALKYLANVVKTDNDPDVAELARKAGVYIRKNAAPQAASRPQQEPAGQNLLTIAYPEEEEAERAAEEPLPSEIEVSQVDKDRAHGYVQQAIDWHMRENNDRAAQYLRRAFAANPKLRHDSYTAGLAATITGLPSNEAVNLLSPSPEELRKRVRRAAGAGVSPAQGMAAFFMFAASVVLLVGYFLFPWLDFSPVRVMGPDGQEITVGETIDQFNSLMRSAREQLEALKGLASGEEVQQLNRLLDTLNRGITMSFSGLDTTLLTLGLRDILDATGLSGFIDIAKELGTPGVVDPSQVTVPETEVEPLDYTLILAPLIGVILLILGLTLLVRGVSSTSVWILSVLLALVGMLPFWWFFTNTRQELLNESANLSMMGQVSVTNISSGTEVIGFGFWFALVAQFALLCLPFIALLAQPSQAEQ